MGLRIDTTMRNESLTPLNRLNGGTIDVYSGSQPADPSAAPTGTLLATFTLANPAFAAPSGGSRALDADPILETTGAAAGTAGWFRARESDGTARMDGTVSATGGGGNLQLNTVTVSVGLTLRITGGLITAPMGT